MRKQILIFITIFQSFALAVPPKIEVARKYFLNKDYIKAHGELSDVSLDKLDSRESSLIEFFHGLIFFEQKNYDFAIESFHQSLGKGTHLRDVVHYYLGLAYLGLHKYALAGKFLKKINQLDSSDFLKRKSDFHLAEILFETKKYNGAEKMFKKMERKMRHSDLHPDILWFLVKINNTKREKAGVCYWSRKLYVRYPTYGSVAHWGLRWKDNLLDGEPLKCRDRIKDQKKRIRRLQWLGAKEKVSREIRQFKKSEKNSFIRDSVVSEYLVNEGMVKEAFDRLKPYYRSRKRQKDEDYIRLFAKAASQSGEYQKALDIYQKAYKSFSGQKALWFLYNGAFLGYQHKDYDGALMRFKELQARYPHTVFGRKTHWYIPWIYYLKGDYQKSFDLMQKALEENIPVLASERLKYWMAMSLERLGHKTRARKLFLEISQDESIGYYSIAAVQRLRNILTPGSLTSLQYDASFVLRENWLTHLTQKEGYQNFNPFQTKVGETGFSLSQWQKLPFMKEYMEAERETAPMHSNIRKLKFREHIEKAKHLSMIGLNDLAKWELYGLEERTKNLENLKTLMFEYYRNRLFHRSAYIGAQYFADARKHLGLHLGAVLWQFVYPRAFEDEVLKHGKNFGVPPEFVWSIMKAETNFRPDALSPVGARGLMQIMTHTGRKVASLMGKNIKDPDLFRPSVGVEIGTRYLKRVLKKFQDKIPLAAAAYNGGPHRVHKWLHQFGQLEMDEFIEHIPFRETRRYVKKVVRYYTLYHLLYNKNSHASSWLADNVNVYPEGTPPTRETWETL